MELNTGIRANIESANSRISDVDVAQESKSLARFNVLVQSGTAMLSQANQSSYGRLEAPGLSVTHLSPVELLQVLEPPR